MKPYPIFVGHDPRLTEYQMGKKGKIPRQEVLEWLVDNIGLNWQFDWEPPVHPVIKNSEIVTTVEEVENSIRTSGATFYFDTEEDRLLFCITWITDQKNQTTESTFWHPV